VLRAGETLEVGAGLGLVLRLAEHLAVDHYLSVAGDHQGVGLVGRDCLGLAGRVSDDEVSRLSLPLLLHLRCPDLEVEAEGLQQRAPLRRA